MESLTLSFNLYLLAFLPGDVNLTEGFYLTDP